jgi:predicted nucleotidyltransferase
MDAPDFADFLDRLADTARERDDVVGLVAFGSTADRTRADRWSDHDFAWITIAGAEDRYRLDLSWLPAAESLAVSVVEHHGGVKAIYDNGHRIEFGIADTAAFSTWAGAPAHIIVGDESIRAATAQVVARRPEGDVDAHREITLMLTQLHSGMGRALRGEVLSASGLVRFEAVNHLARALAARLVEPTGRLDPLDPRRRFDAAFPAIAERLERAARLPIESCARELVAIATDELEPGWDGFPRRGLEAVQRSLDLS